MTVGRTYMRGACHAKHVQDHSSVATLQTVLPPTPKHRRITSKIGRESEAKSHSSSPAGTAVQEYPNPTFNRNCPATCTFCSPVPGQVRYGRVHIIYRPVPGRPLNPSEHTLPPIGEYENFHSSQAWGYQSGQSPHVMRPKKFQPYQPIRTHPPPYRGI